jgi:hypothetical protein
MADVEKMTAEDFLERKAGSDESRAWLWAETVGNCEAAYQEFRAVPGMEDKYPSEMPPNIIDALHTIAKSEIKIWPSDPDRNDPRDC